MLLPFRKKEVILQPVVNKYEALMLNYSEFRNKYPKQTCLDLTKDIFQRIEEKKELNIFITLNEEDALKAASISDKRFADGNPRELEGMIIAVKDNISTKNLRTTCASKMLENFIPVYDATVIARLKEAGAVIIGKTNMDEFAMGSSNETSFFGNTLNPHNPEYVPGGSSGGSAAAVAAGFCHVALGSDTGGSVRQPAAFCGTFGIKPTYGRISRYGLVAFASSLDQIGIFASTAEDTAMVLDTVSGEDKYDATSSAKPSVKSHAAIESGNSEKYKVGILKKEILDDCDENVRKTYSDFVDKIRSAGCTVSEIDFDNPEAWVAVYQIVATAEASSNLARFDGVRYGFRADTEEGEDFVVKTRSEGFGDEVKRRIMLGTYVLSSGYYDAYYNKALKARRLVFDNYAKIFRDVDFIAMPTTPSPPFKFGEKSDNPVEMYLSDYFTAAANLAGIPALSMPFGISDNNLPVGMQLQAPAFEEEKLMQFSALISK